MEPTIPLPHPPRRLAIIKPSALGDVMHALPVLTALRRRFPEAHITWVVNRLYEPLLKPHPHLDATLGFDRGTSRGLRAGVTLVRFLRLLRRQRFDVALDLQGLFRSGLMALATGAPVRVGLASAREGAGWFYTHRVPDLRGGEHAVDRCWRVAEALGAGGGPKEFNLPVDATALAWARERLRTLPRPWLAVGVGARWLTKRWPPEHFAELIRRAQARFGGTAVFVGAPDEAELARRAAGLVAGPVLECAGATTVAQLAALLAECDVMLSNDTGPLHLAVALGRPVVAPYTCTSVRLNGPYGHFARTAETRVACAGSYLRRCGRLDCVAELTPDRLWPALDETLLAWQRQPRSA